MTIRPYGKYTDVRTAAEVPAADAHGLDPRELERLGQYWSQVVGQRDAQKLAQQRTRMDSFVPRVSGGGSSSAHEVLGPLLPRGATLSPGAGHNYRNAVRRTHETALGRRTASHGTGLDSNTYMTQQRPYQPEYESPDRQNYPVHRILANRYFRLFWKLDPVIGNCIEMYSDLPWGNFELTGEGVTGEIKDRYEHMCEVTKLRSMLPYFIREYLIVGECAPHLFFDDSEGIWTYIALHNPDQLEVIDSPFIRMDPIVEFVPDDKLRQVLTSNHPMLKNVREQMPDEVLSRLMSRQNIPLSPLNFTFIPRKLHPYDTRGTSLLSRMWRILMYEDAIFNASIATARRHAGPLKIAKLGDAATGYIPPPDQERRLLELLAQAELDVNAWLVYHYAINFEMVGTTDRIMSIDKHWELIERVKLVAMGVSKAFLHGEVTYASAASGLTVFLQRLKALRDFFESEWIYPKFFKTVAKINNWVKPNPADHAQKRASEGPFIRTSQKSLRDGEERLIVPKIEWERALDPKIDQEKITAMSNLSSSLGIRFSKQSAFATVGKDYEEEVQQLIAESEMEQNLIQKYPQLAQLLAPPAAGPGGGGGGGAGAGVPLPPLPTENFDGFAPSDPGAGGESAPVEPEASKEADGDGKGGSGLPNKPSSSVFVNGRYGDWAEDEVKSLADLFSRGETDDEPWYSMLETSEAARDAIDLEDTDMLWAAVEAWLIDEGYPSKAIQDLEDLLKLEGTLQGPTRAQRKALRKELKQAVKKTQHLPQSEFLSGAQAKRIPPRTAQPLLNSGRRKR
jgi:hypothetical protein